MGLPLTLALNPALALSLSLIPTALPSTPTMPVSLLSLTPTPTSGGMLCYKTSSFVKALNSRVSEYSSCSGVGATAMSNMTQPMLRGAR